jgi:hypothetical protein
MNRDEDKEGTVITREEMSRAVVVITETILGFDRYGISREGVIYDFEKKRFLNPYLNNCYYKVHLTKDGATELFGEFSVLNKIE